MKFQTPILLLLILEVFSESGLRERPSDDIASQAICASSCRLFPTDKDCEDECIERLPNVTAHDSEAKANVKLVCQDYEVVFLSVDPEGIFIVETRNESGDWNEGFVWRYMGILPQHVGNTENGNGYQWRFTRADYDGISKSETTKWIKPLPPDVEPMKVTNISLQCLKREGELIAAEISFDPSEDRCCQYQMTWRRSNSDYMGTTTINVTAPGKLYVLLEHLPFGEDFTVSVQPRTSTTIGEETFLSVSTPSYWKSDNISRICVPVEVEGINATVNHCVDDIFNVTVTWDSPEVIPDFFIVDMVSTGTQAGGPCIRNLSGTDNETLFSNVEISEKFVVSIRAWTLAGGSVKISKHFPILRKSINADTRSVDAEDPLIVVGIGVGIVTALSCVGLGLATGLYMYFKIRGPRRYLPSSQSIKLKQMDQYKIDPSRLEVLRVLGSGSFRVVKLGRLRDEKGQVTNVLVKMLRDDKNERDLENFRREIKIMKSLDSHPNIVSTLGYYSAVHSSFLVVEYFPRGDLLSFLHATLQMSVTTVNENGQPISKRGYDGDAVVLEENPEGTSTPYSNVTMLDMLNFGRQIATGMGYLSSKNIVHGDLAAKNVFVSDNRVLKISDFGLERDIHMENDDRESDGGRTPVKWMAIESLMHQIYTTHSDVWSFGVLLWEIVTLGCTPYPGVSGSRIMELLDTGYRMERPVKCSKPLYNVMMSCWKTAPTDRPTFTMVRETLGKLIRAAAGDGYSVADDVSGSITLEKDI